MKRLLSILVLPILAHLAVANTTGAQLGQKATLDVVEWFNSPPISSDLLQGKTVLVEVFRTW